MERARVKAKIIGTDKEIFIISRCPVCGFVYGVVPPDRGAIYYNPYYVEISKKELHEIPQRLCIRRNCPAYELEMKKRGDKKSPTYMVGQ